MNDLSFRPGAALSAAVFVPGFLYQAIKLAL